jgi:hypothetical protein
MTRALGLYADPQTYTALVWLLLGLPLGILWFTLVVTGLSLGLGLAVTVLGLPVLVLTLLLARGIGAVERRLAESLVDAPMPRLGRVDDPSGIFWRRLVALVARRRTWNEVAYALVRLPLGVVDFAVAVAVVAVSLGGFAQVILVAAGLHSDVGDWHVDTVAESLLFLVPSAAGLLVAPAILRGWARLSAAVATALLGRVEQEELKRRIGRLLARGDADAFSLLADLELALGRGPFLTPAHVQAALLALRDNGLVAARRVGARDVWSLTRSA